MLKINSEKVCLENVDSYRLYELNLLAKRLKLKQYRLHVTRCSMKEEKVVSCVVKQLVSVETVVDKFHFYQARHSVASCK